MLNTFFRDYFGFNREQRQGLVKLITISFLLLVARIAYPYIIPREEIVIKNLPLLEAKIDSAEKSRSYLRKKEERNVKSELFAFNPNTASLQQLIKLGFKEKTAQRFIKFRSSGFVFRTKADLKKVYGVSDDFYLRLEPYIIIKGEQTYFKNSGKQKTESANLVKQTKKVELNAADSTMLVQLNGIGPSYAKRILKYRSILGGFVAIEQLKEVYGLTEEVYGKINGFFTVDLTLVKKINLNKDDFKTVNKHPYISYELTKSIFDWRRKTNINPTTLKDIVGDPALCARLLPYLTFD